ncbi:MAG: hydrolase, partial [Candidatus Saccharibacteria bacterium]
MDNNITDNTICCPKFKPKNWDQKEFEWQDKKFIKDSTKTFMYMPLNFGALMKRLQTKVDKADASTPDWLCLSDHISKWKMDVYLAVDKEIEDTDNVAISGIFICKVYDGSYQDTSKWRKDLAAYAKGKDYK